MSAACGTSTAVPIAALRTGAPTGARTRSTADARNPNGGEQHPGCSPHPGLPHEPGRPARSSRREPCCGCSRARCARRRRGNTSSTRRWIMISPSTWATSAAPSNRCAASVASIAPAAIRSNTRGGVRSDPQWVRQAEAGAGSARIRNVTRSSYGWRAAGPHQHRKRWRQDQPVPPLSNQDDPMAGTAILIFPKVSRRDAHLRAQRRGDRPMRGVPGSVSRPWRARAVAGRGMRPRATRRAGRAGA